MAVNASIRSTPTPSAIVIFEDTNVAASTVKHKPKPIRVVEAKQFNEKARNRRKYSRRVRRYYHEQAVLLKSYKEDRDRLAIFTPPAGADEASSVTETVECDKERALENLSFACNFVLLIGKIAATIMSESLSILSSMVDSLVDNTTNIVITVSSWAIRNRDPFHYPRGRTRLEPLALMIISVIMGIASLQVIVKTVESLIEGKIEPKIFLTDTNGTVTNELDWRVAGVMLGTIVVKFCLCVMCYSLARNSPTARVLAQDHRNDCLSNTVAIACGLLGQKYWPYVDPIGAIVISLYICSNWMITGYKQISILTGHSAPPYFISRIIKICMEHNQEILHVDAVTVYHFGSRFLVEVDIVVKENTTVRHAHDISDPLQRKLEHLPDVERAFVHVEYQTKHSPSIEHKTV